MLIAVIQQRGDLGLLTLTALLQIIMWGAVTTIYWIKRDTGKVTWYYGQLDIWICTLLAVAWLVGLILFLLGQCKRGFGGGPSCRLLIYENAFMVLGAALFFLAAGLACAGRLVLLLSNTVDNLQTLQDFCLATLLTYIAIMLLSVCLLVGRAAIA